MNNEENELIEVAATAVIQKSLIQNILLTLFEKGSLTAEEVRLIVRYAGVSLASEVADRRTAPGSESDQAGADQMAEAGEIYLAELEESILGQPDTDILAEDEADNEDE